MLTTISSSTYIFLEWHCIVENQKTLDFGMKELEFHPEIVSDERII
jgi:hypothetical protein